MRAADHILDIGPSAGELGGRVIYEGDFPGLIANDASLTARYLRGETEIKEPKQRRLFQKRRLTLRGAAEHNLKSIDVELPLDMLVCITGVSGSGKSTLIRNCIYAGLKKQKGDWQGHVGAFQKLEGGQLVDDVILVDQSPIGRTPRSNPVTYIKIYDAIREVFASTREAQGRGRSSALLFQPARGRGEVCQERDSHRGNAVLADVELSVRMQRHALQAAEILDIRYRGKNVHDVLRSYGPGSNHVFCREFPKLLIPARPGRCGSGIFVSVNHNHSFPARGPAHQTCRASFETHRLEHTLHL